MKGQKDAVVEKVKALLPGFIPYKTVALAVLSQAQLESLKQDITVSIMSGAVDYGKDRTIGSEVVPYARSMVMNHLKKCRELNGNVEYASTSSKVRVIPGLTLELLPQDLQDYVRTLV
jgi:hypothetical protein